MKKLLLFINVKHAKSCFVLICSMLFLGSGTISAKSTETNNKTYFPTCTLTVTASISGSGGGSICQGTSVTLTATASGGTTPYTYSWLPTMGLSNAAIANPVATPTATTTYTVEVWDHSGCSATSSVNIVVNDPPTVNQDTLLLQYLTHEPLSATGGTPPYTYNFSPVISTSSLVTLLTSTVTTVYTITVTGANDCSSTYNATFVPLESPSTGGACTTPFISEYIQDTVISSWGGMDNGIEVYNPTSSSLNLSGYYLVGTTNGSLSATPFFIKLHGSILAHKTFLIANRFADTALTNKAQMLSDSLTFGGKDIVSLAHIVVSSPDLTFSFLDAVGAISPLPNADSGWAVGSGCTKNHTLVRQASTTEGTMNWSASETEWNVYPRGTFTYIGHYSNVCTPTDPDIYFTLSPPSTNCSEPSYVNFTVSAASNPSTIFNSCVLYISFDGGEFTGDDVSNGGVQVTQGSDFTYSYGDNDYSTPTVTVTDSIMEIVFGDPSDSSPNGTQIDNSGDILFNIQLRIQNSCDSGVISIVNSMANSASYTSIDSTSSTISYCGDYSTPCYDPVADTCYDGSPCQSATIYTYSYSTLPYSSAICSGGGTASGCPIQITGHYNSIFNNNSIAAGTNAKSDPANSSILTINGIGFGNTPFIIKVSDANSGFDGKGAENMIELDGVDILSWTENQIKVKMPSYLIGDTNNVTPGSGPYIVTNSCEESASENVQINYNIINDIDTSYTKVRSNIVMANSMESYLWRCDTSISNNPKALACVKKAIREWNCYTGVNWKLGADTTRDTTAIQDGVSAIWLSRDFPPHSGTVMETFTDLYLSCYSGDSVEFIDEADIKVNSDPALNYSYDTTGIGYSPDSTYFYDALLHEMGHAHRLGHINDTLSLMYWFTAVYRPSIITGVTYPGPATLEGGLDVVNTSVAHSPGSLGCGSYGVLVPITRECIDHTLDVPIISQNPYDLSLYPNPDVGGTITVSYQLTANSQVQFKMTDCTGRILITLPQEQKNPGTYSEGININDLAGGVYFFIATINGATQTIKFIKL